MKAMVLAVQDGQSTIVEADLAEPQLVPGQILVEVRAASINRADLAARAAHGAVGQSASPAVVGMDAAGVVVAAAPDVEAGVGERVMAMVGGGLAERVAVDARMAVPLPDGWSFEEGAASILGLMTEHNALVTVGRLTAGEAVVVHAAASGVGQMGVQMARRLGAGTVIATVRRPRGEELLHSLGADHVIVAEGGRFADEVLALTGGAGADVIVDHVGGPYLEENVRAAALKGRIVGVGRLGGPTGTLDLETLALKRLEILGVTFRTRTPEEKAALVRTMAADLSAHMADGALRPRIDRVLPWTDVLTAQNLVASDEHLGKVVLTVRP